MSLDFVCVLGVCVCQVRERLRVALERVSTLEGQLASTTQEVRCVNVCVHLCVCVCVCVCVCTLLCVLICK